MEDIGARLRYEVDKLVAEMMIDSDGEYAAFMKRHETLTADERAASDYFAETIASAYEKARADRDDAR